MTVMDLMQIPSLAKWPEHRRVLARAIEHFQNDPRVPGILLGGSFASGTPDFYSDVDLYIVVRDEQFEDLLAEKETAAAAAGRVFTRFVPDHLGPGGDEMYIAVYEGPVKVDFNYVRQSTVTPNWKLTRYLLLKDAGGTLAGVLRASAGLAVPPPTRQELDAFHNKFWTWCWYVFGKVVRGELWEALDGVHAIRSLALIPIAEWDANRPREGHRRLEFRLDHDVRARLAMTVPSLDCAALYRALQAEIELFRKLQARVWPRYAVLVNETAGRQIEEAIRRSWKDVQGAGEEMTPIPPRYQATDWIDPRIQICSSPIHGRGMFAAAPIRSGETVTIWGGTFLLREPDPRKKKEWRAKGYALGTIGEGLYLASLPGEGEEDLTYLINHSCDPNVWMRDEVTLEARRDIAPGVELTMDYAMIEENEEWIGPFECRCGSKLCRGRFTGKDWRRQDLQARYGEHFSPFLNERVRRLRTEAG